MEHSLKNIISSFIIWYKDTDAALCLEIVEGKRKYCGGKVAHREIDKEKERNIDTISSKAWYQKCAIN